MSADGCTHNRVLCHECDGPHSGSTLPVGEDELMRELGAWMRAGRRALRRIERDIEGET